VPEFIVNPQFTVGNNKAPDVSVKHKEGDTTKDYRSEIALMSEGSRPGLESFGSYSLIQPKIKEREREDKSPINKDYPADQQAHYETTAGYESGPENLIVKRCSFAKRPVSHKQRIFKSFCKARP